ncbi:MAG: 1-acyl-sn-glycerol-3-phosphate acyltransferase [Bacteroidales bacterium]|nr:1-acyl-sn-glycerol-3-phosphate acyltransferase [Bacteroidales bacterium]
MKRIWMGIVRICGWKYNIPECGTRPELQHCVIAVAPHTSIDDFFLGACCLWKLGINFRIFIKKEFFNKFTRVILDKLAIPVDRGNRSNGLVAQAVKYFNENDDFALVVTPEGTRKAVKRWKRGFYEIAVEAKVPIVLAYVDYGKKTMGVGPTFYPTGDFSADLPKIMDFYKDITPRHKEGYNKECPND